MEAHRRACPQHLRPLLKESPVVEWHRVQAYQDVSLKLILQEVLQEIARKRASDKVFLHREVVREPLHQMPCLPADEFHLYVSPHNVGASSFVDLLQLHHRSQAARSRARRSAGSPSRSFRSFRSFRTHRSLSSLHPLRSLRSTRPRSEQLSVTSDPMQMSRALHFLCYLNAKTHTSGSSTTQFHAELEHALRAGMHILLVHETRLEADGAPFKTIIDATPEKLKWNVASAEKRLYKELAVMICGSTTNNGRQHLDVGLHLLLNAVAVLPTHRHDASQQDSEAELAELGDRVSLLDSPDLAEGSASLFDSPTAVDATQQLASAPPSSAGSPLSSVSTACPSKLTRQNTSRRHTLMMDHRRLSSQGLTKEGPGRMNSSRERSRHSADQEAEPDTTRSSLATHHSPGSSSASAGEDTRAASVDESCNSDARRAQSRFAALRRSSSREEALARKKSVSATSRPEKVLRRCVQMPGQAARVVQSGVGTMCQNVNTLPAVKSVKQAIFGAAAAETAESTDRESGWKSSRLRAAIQSRSLAAEVEQAKIKNDHLTAMVENLQAQLKTALASANTQLPEMQSADTASGAQCPGRRRPSAAVAAPKADCRRRSVNLPAPTALPRPIRKSGSSDDCSARPPSSLADQCTTPPSADAPTCSPQPSSTWRGVLYHQERRDSILAVDDSRRSHVGRNANRSAPPTTRQLSQERRLRHGVPLAMPSNENLPAPSVPPPPMCDATSDHGGEDGAGGGPSVPIERVATPSPQHATTAVQSCRPAARVLADDQLTRRLPSQRADDRRSRPTPQGHHAVYL